MLTLNIRQLEQKLPAWIEARLSVAIIGPPGTGKTYTSRAVATATGRPVEVLDGGQENEWKGLFPYRMPTNGIHIGRAMMASGGTLIIDEFNRVPPEMKTSFQLLASEKIVPWPEGGVREIDIAIVATANDSDLGVEEAARAELDRYDLIVKLMPTSDEIGAIVGKQANISPNAAAEIFRAVAELSGKLDAKKFHKPEGIRMAISIARVLLSGTLGPADAFSGAAERCWPLGRTGAEKYRGDFDSVVRGVANNFASKIAGVALTAVSTVPQQATSTTPTVGSLKDLQAVLKTSLQTTISTPQLMLPLPFSSLRVEFTQAFGFGVTKHLTVNGKPGRSASRRGVKVHFGENGTGDSIEFSGAEKHQVEKFLSLVLQAQGTPVTV